LEAKQNMLKKAAVAVFGLILAITFFAPAKAAAEVHVGVAIGAPVAYGAYVQPYGTYEQPYVAYEQPYVAYEQPYVTYAQPVYGGYYGEGRWDRGHHYGWRNHESRERGYYGHNRHER
jgi:hypothetical protein